MNVSIKVRLSEAGQKTSILAGGSGQRVQVVPVAADAPEFRAVVLAGTVMPDGSVVLDHTYYAGTEWDHLPTAAEVLADDERRAAEETAAAQTAAERRRAATLAVLTERCAVAHTVAALGGAEFSFRTADWPYNSDPEITGSAEAVAWEAELATERAAAEAARDAATAAEVARRAEAERVVDERRAAWRAANGLEDGDVALRVEEGCLASVPKGCWQSHARGKNWLAIIASNPSCPGGLERDFADKAKGDLYYHLPALSVGTPVEFGADYYIGGGRKSPTRWYGFAVKQFAGPDQDGEAATFLVLRQCGTGKAAIKAGEKYAAEHGGPLEGPRAADEFDAALVRVNGEGGIVPAPSVN